MCVVAFSIKLKTRYYFGDYEKETDEFGNVTETDYLYTPAGLTAMQRKTSSGAGLYYIHTDLLGSIERVTNATGQLVSEYTYTPWGGRVLLSGVNITDRGYTGHEHLTPFGDDSNSGFCLINMNGRIYDPVLARFLSPDPYVQAPDFTQSFNRYAYGWNNPFKFTDPSGNSIIAAILIGGGINLVSQILAGNVSSVQDAYLAFGIGGLSGLVGAGIGQVVSSALGGSIGAIGAALSGAAGGAAGNFIGVTGNSWFNGANFKDGLLQGLKGAGAGALSGGIFGGISGGIYSVKHGGNFWTGEGATFTCMLQPETDNRVKVGKNMEYNNEYAKEFSDEHFGTIKKLDNLYADGRIPKGYTKNGGLVFNPKGAHVGGVTEFNGIGKGSNVYLFKSAFTSMERLYLVMGHEYLHVYFNANGYSMSHKAKERVSYKWNIDQAKVWGLSTTYYVKMYNSYYQKDLYPVLDYSKAGFFILPKRPW